MDVLVVGVAPDVLDPPSHVVEGLLVGDVVHDDGPEGVPVVGRGDGPVPLLPRRVPNLGLDGLAVHLDRPCGELYSDCGLRLQIELIPREPG